MLVAPKMQITPRQNPRPWLTGNKNAFGELK